MPCVVYLQRSKGLIVVKSAWCDKINDAKSINSGLHPGRKRKIFFSPEKKAKADFQMEPKTVFDGNIAACYFGFVLRNCGKSFANK